MKINLLAFVFALAVFTGIGCEKDLNDIGFEIGQSFDLPFDQTAVSSDGIIEVNFNNVKSDSRCPADVVCVWEGEVSVELAVKINSNTEQITLSSHPDFGQSDTIAPYIFTLLDVQPYPCCHEQPIDEADYVIELLVETL